LTSPGLAAAHSLLEDRSRLKTRILCIDMEPEVIDRLKTSGYAVHDVSMGYRTGKRSFAFPPPNEVDLIVCDLRRPGCFDVSDWGPQGANNNFDCRLLPYEQADPSFTVSGGLRSARFQVIRESQLGDAIPGTFGPSDVNRAIREVGIPFLLFLNSGWLDRISSFPNWTNLTWNFRPTAASQIELVEPLPSLLPELNREIKFKLVVRHGLNSGPKSLQKSSPHSVLGCEIVRNNVGDIFGQLVRLGKGTLWLIPETDQNVDVIGLFAARLEKIRLLSDKPEHREAAGPLKAATSKRESVGATEAPRQSQGSMREAGVEKVSPTDGKKPRRVFIGHGRSPVWRELKDFLKDRLGLEWDEFNRESVAGKSTKERLEVMLAGAAFAFLVMTAEDADPDGNLHPRENVIHEAGLFQGHLGFERAIILLEQGCQEFSNIHGLTHIPSPRDESRRFLRRYGEC
jgi:predicted nucleotide-binding protein